MSERITRKCSSAWIRFMGTHFARQSRSLQDKVMTGIESSFRPLSPFYVAIHVEACCRTSLIHRSAGGAVVGRGRTGQKDDPVLFQIERLRALGDLVEGWTTEPCRKG